MGALELPTLAIEVVAAIGAASRPLLTNRDPGPDESDVPLTSTIALEIVDPGTAGIDRKATRVWVDGALAFDGTASPEVAGAFGGPRAGVTAAPDTLRIVLDPGAPFASQAGISVRVVSDTTGGGHPSTRPMRLPLRTEPRHDSLRPLLRRHALFVSRSTSPCSSSTLPPSRSRRSMLPRFRSSSSKRAPSTRLSRS
jgi:hypothetical protein